MTTGFPDARMQPSEGEETCVAGASVGDVLRLLSAGATGAILMALGEGPLRTKNLTERVPGYTPRTIYRYAGKLADLDVVEREEEPGVPSKVLYRLTEGCGRELYELINRFAGASMTRLPDGRIDAHAWASLGLLADLWESGMGAELSCEPRSPTDLARGSHGLSYHQVNRRAGLFKTAGLLSESEGPGRRRNYELTHKTRRKMGLIVGVSHWHRRHVAAEGEEGMSAAEMATVLRVALPLASVPEHAGKCLEVSVLSEDGTASDAGEVFWSEVETEGDLHSCAAPGASPDGWSRGKVQAWIETLLEGQPNKVLVGGDEKLVGDCVAGLYDALWSPVPF